ncbi:M43 family zinc metalloprotease [Arcicella sp. LKC2W]|uniref:M43 family zinc metalloprotease n=1 Tax=Arcicella sp. LKC2W TaxID=2984198 RepID=UPI002B1FB7AA|nr:M43 family zinc metalloprotease [Arcicella sp. LKC2W]MEA5459214.1 M43 family zinc metalloprotease [Arcicella sp. LKC2W]
MKYYFLFAMWGIILSFNTIAQRPSNDCASSTPSISVFNSNQTKIDQIRLSGVNDNGITYVPIRVNIIRRNDGTGGATLDIINRGLARTNALYINSNIQFYFCGTTPNYINNTTYYDFTNTNEDALANSNDVTNAINFYIVNSINVSGFGGACGYAYYPTTANPKATNRVFFDDDCVDYSSFPHELGHYLNLIHTFDRANGAELVTRGVGANCTTAGDLLCDTPADPYGLSGNNRSGCSYTGTAVDANNQTFSPLTNNIMSYYDVCRTSFTTGQYNRAKDGLLLRLSPATTVSERYTLDCSGTILTAPSSVIATISGTNATITWTDNSTTEMGFIIERSTSSTTGFVAVGGVAPNVTTFTDNTVMTGTSYFYRVRASNTTDNYSNVASTGGASCPATLTLTTSINSGSQVFQASNSITSTSQISGTGTDVTYRAASQIVLNQGFKVGLGSLFKGRISACNVSARQASESALYVNQEIEGVELSAYPNPVSNGEVIIQYTLPEDGNASINLANMSGINVKNIVEEKFHEKGTYKVKATLSDLKTGIYLYILQGDKVRLAKKLVIE